MEACESIRKREIASGSVGSGVEGGGMVPTWEVEHGGRGATDDEARRIAAALGDYESADLYPYGVGISLVGPVLRERGTAEQHADQERGQDMLGEPNDEFIAIFILTKERGSPGTEELLGFAGLSIGEFTMPFCPAGPAVECGDGNACAGADVLDEGILVGNRAGGISPDVVNGAEILAGFPRGDV